MDLRIFNIALLIGWTLVLIGGCVIHLGAGLAFAGLLLLAVTFAVSRMAGIYAAPAEKKETD